MTTILPTQAITEGPSVQWKHIDGPLLLWAGHMHWLTAQERAALLFRHKTVDDIARFHWPHLVRLRNALKEQPNQGEIQ